jgi:hypothetical protein
VVFVELWAIAFIQSLNGNAVPARGVSGVLGGSLVLAAGC